MNRDDAWALLTEYTQSDSLRKHALAVEAAVRGYARRFGDDENGWGIVALLHDFLMTVGIFALLGRELTLTMVGAVLTIAGYSINDTIVVFDRIRSGLRDRLSGSVAEVMNTSINETLSRTILTGGTVLLTVLALYFFGGPVLNDFAFSFLIGVIVGTYSSIFIASPIVLWWTRARGRDTSALRREVIQQTTTAGRLAPRS